MCLVQKTTQQHQASWAELGRAVGFSTRASRSGVGFYTTVYMYCNWFLAGFTLLAVSIYLF